MLSFIADQLSQDEFWRDIRDNGIHSIILSLRDQVNQATKFTYRQQFVQRVLAIASSTSSIVFCLVALYLFLAIDPRRLVFRHHLIAFLLFYDMLKAVILLIYPTRVLTVNTAYYNNNFCQVVGFFTATAVEGADFAILAFSIHICLLIFKPQLTVRLPHGRTEGGLYLYRTYIYVLLFLIPLVLASLAYVKGTGYQSYVCWCSLPQQPIWYRLVLSWLPRYLIVITIFTVYCMIYFHVIKEFKSLGGVFKNLHSSGRSPEDAKKREMLMKQRPTFFSAIWYAAKSFFDNYSPKFVYPTQNDIDRIKSTSSNVDPKQSSHTLHHNHDNHNLEDKINEHADSSGSGSTEDEEAITEYVQKPDIYEENLENFRKRQKIIEKQMKSIFIYPIAYVFIWLFPFVLYVTQIKYEQTHPPIYWLNCMGAFMQPFNGFVDSLVFFYREVPWEYTVMKNFEKQYGDRIGGLIQQQRKQRHSPSDDSGSIATSAKLTSHSISMSMAVDLNEYPVWRRWLHWLKFPLFQLPTEENITKFQLKYATDQNNNGTPDDTFKGAYLPQTHLVLHGDDSGPTDQSGGIHDFSNILGGDNSDFRNNLDDYTLNFSQKRLSNVSGSTPSKRVSILNKSSKSRQISTFTPSIRMGSIVDGIGARRSQQPSVGNDSVPGDPNDGNEMDFLEFLKKGPQ